MGRRRTGISYHDSMLDHQCTTNEHPECPERVRAIREHLQQLGLWDKCHVYEGRDLSDAELCSILSQELINRLNEIPHLNQEQLNQFAKTYLDSPYENCGNYLCPESASVARRAAGSCVQLVEEILDGKIGNGLALVRPPGHHASFNEQTGFCLINNVAAAAKRAIDLGIERILIVDFDVHHGQGTQRIFYDDKRVLYLSMHRYENAKFWPSLAESNFDYIGSGSAAGYNVNVPLNETGCTDSDYLAIFCHIVLPLAHEFSPQLVLVSAGFDAVLGDPLGEMRLSVQIFGVFVHLLQTLAQGKILLCLEGGYSIPMITQCAEVCLRSLLGETPPRLHSPLNRVKDSTWKSILDVCSVLKGTWDCFNFFPDSQDDQYSTWKTHESAGPANSVSSNERGRDADSIQSASSSFCPTVGLAYDPLMLRHKCSISHPERPNRISAIQSRLDSDGLVQKCIKLATRRSTDSELTLIHDKDYVKLIQKSEKMKTNDRNKLACTYNSIFMNEYSVDCARLAAGAVLEGVDALLSDPPSCGSAFCNVRPPGHHAEENNAYGFCFFDNVALGAKYAMDKYKVEKILIVDFDVHHGNGVQECFYKNPNVLYVSLHRFDDASFFPGGDEGHSSCIGEEGGEGFNVNIAWSGPSMGNQEYINAFCRLVLPVSFSFNPDLVLISAGFDAAAGDRLGQYKLTAEMYAFMTHCMRTLANGKVLMALEGGYCLTAISGAASACVKVLLGGTSDSVPLDSKVNNRAWEAMRKTLDAHANHWDLLQGIKRRIDSFDALSHKMKTLNVEENSPSQDKQNVTPNESVAKSSVPNQEQVPSKPPPPTDNSVIIDGNDNFVHNS